MNASVQLVITPKDLVKSFIDINKILRKSSESKAINVLSIPHDFLKYIKGFSLLPKEILDYIYCDLLEYTILTSTYINQTSTHKYNFTAYHPHINKRIPVIYNIPKYITTTDNVTHRVPLITFNDIFINESSIMIEYPPILERTIQQYKRIYESVTLNLFDIFDTDVFMHDWNYHRGRHILFKTLNKLVNINNVKKYILISNETVDLCEETASIHILQFMVLTDNDVIIDYDIRNMYMYLTEFHPSYNEPEYFGG